jgi:nucleoside-diphosphate-sugar epimerase
MESEREIIEMMRAAAPPGQPSLGDTAVRQLQRLTESLVTAKGGASEEYERFRAISQRALCLPQALLTEWLQGAVVLVTGGTGCIGSTLMAQLAALRLSRLVSLSRGVTSDRPRLAGAEYLRADIRDRDRLDALIRDIRPDVIFHVAAQRNPGLAEIEVHRTVSTNVLGTRNVLAAAAAAGVPQVVCASTGKALRPYSPDVYAASKRAAEWIASMSSGGDMRCSAGRFTHVVDNSIVVHRLHEWAKGGIVRLHSTEIAFYIQSALESAQLLLIAGLGAVRGAFRVHAITDLGWPVSLLDLTVGVLAAAESDTPIYISGYDPGYEEIPFPGLYDPATAGEVSPLLNAFEAARVTEAPCHMVDAFPLEMRPDRQPVKLLTSIEEACEMTEDPDTIRGALDELSWSLLDVTLQAAPTQALARSAAFADPHRHGLSAEHQRLLAAIRRDAGLSDSVLAGGRQEQ